MGEADNSKRSAWERLVDAGAEALTQASSGFFVQGRNAHEMSAIVLNAMVASQSDHFVTFDADGWFIEHSMACRVAGTLGTCRCNRAIREVYDEPPPEDQWGRWRITDVDSEGLPLLERAEGGPS